MKNSDLIYPKLNHFINSLEVSTISEERKNVLQPLKDLTQQLMWEHQPIELIFICTHNSRRSILAQIWAQALAAYYRLPNIQCYSGGTEATEVFQEIVEVLKKSGFKITNSAELKNPVYTISYSEGLPVVSAFSKLYNDPKNPHKDFTAVMTCSNSEQNCSFIPGAKKRIPIYYEDPKISDGTIQQEKVYLERSKQIATEMKYVFSSISTS